MVTTAVSIQGCFATGGAIQGVAYGMMSFHSGYNGWHILLPCEGAQCDWYHRHMLNYAFGTGGMTMSDIAISSWCSTERQGDTSESVVFHFLLLGVWDRCLFACVWLLCLFVLFFGFRRHLAFLFTYSPISGNSQSKTKCFYDRLSFERARHGQKKNPHL